MRNALQPRAFIFCFVLLVFAFTSRSEKTEKALSFPAIRINVKEGPNNENFFRLRYLSQPDCSHEKTKNRRQKERDRYVLTVPRSEFHSVIDEVNAFVVSRHF